VFTTFILQIEASDGLGTEPAPGAQKQRNRHSIAATNLLSGVLAMTRVFRSIVASLALLATLGTVAAFAQTASPSPAAKPAPRMGTAKKMPARDPKTGKFVKSNKMTGKAGTKKSLPRDKNGRFIKKAVAPSPAPSKTP
jgi:hypothetical protein